MYLAGEAMTQVASWDESIPGVHTFAPILQQLGPTNIDDSTRERLSRWLFCRLGLEELYLHLKIDLDYKCLRRGVLHGRLLVGNPEFSQPISWTINLKYGTDAGRIKIGNRNGLTPEQACRYTRQLVDTVNGGWIWVHGYSQDEHAEVSVIVRQPRDQEGLQGTITPDTVRCYVSTKGSLRQVAVIRLVAGNGYTQVITNFGTISIPDTDNRTSTRYTACECTLDGTPLELL